MSIHRTALVNISRAPGTYDSLPALLVAGRHTVLQRLLVYSTLRLRMQITSHLRIHFIVWSVSLTMDVYKAGVGRVDSS